MLNEPLQPERQRDEQRPLDCQLHPTTRVGVFGEQGFLCGMEMDSVIQHLEKRGRESEKEERREKERGNVYELGCRLKSRPTPVCPLYGPGIRRTCTIYLKASVHYSQLYLILIQG